MTTTTLSANEVSVAKPVQGTSGPIYVGKSDVTVPTDAIAKLTADFTGLGYVSEGGWSENLDKETVEIKEWGGLVVLRPVTGTTLTYSFALLQTNPDVMKFVYGADNVTGTSAATGFSVVKNGADLPRQPIVVETLMTDGLIKRTVIPLGQITEIGEVANQAGEAVQYQVTVTAFPDEDGNYATDFYAKPAVE